MLTPLRGTQQVVTGGAKSERDLIVRYFDSIFLLSTKSSCVHDFKKNTGTAKGNSPNHAENEQ